MINDFSYMTFQVFLWNIAKRARIIGLPVIDKQIRHMGHTIFGWPTLKIMCDTPTLYPPSKMAAIAFSRNIIKL